jgi:hypothetical protein
MSSLYTDGVLRLCALYNITPTYDNTVCGDATGIGDILFRILCIKNGLIQDPFTINVGYFTQEYYRTNPIPQLEFRLQLIRDLVHCSNIPATRVRYCFSTNMHINQSLPYSSINNFTLRLDDDLPVLLSEKYIIFHTKCRHTTSENYSTLKNNIANFCKTFKSRYKIIIMGERIFPQNEEVDWHGITTVYDELRLLSNCNDVSDVTIENIYSNLDYNSYKSDVSIIKHATYNILFGLGGQLCTSLLFGKSTIYYSTDDRFNTTYLEMNNHIQCTDINIMFDKIHHTCGSQTTL